jgi:anti-sigma-K factor RskA
MTAPPDDILDLLTAYALGVIEPDEIARVSVLLEEQPELRATLAELRATADMLPFGLPEASPPAELRQRTLDFATGRSTSAAPSPPRRVANRMRGWVLGLSGVAAVALLVATIGWAQLFQARDELAQSRTELVQTRDQLTQSRAELVQIQGQMADVQEVIASLTGDGSSASIMRTRAGETVLIAQLPPLEAGRVYQLWRIQDGSAPASAGIFRVSAEGYTTAALPASQQPRAGETVAVTNEPDGGSPGPTTKPLIAGTSNA